MVMPIVEAVLRQLIDVEAMVEDTQMTYVSGSTNHGLEMDGITCSYGHRGSSHMGNRPKLKDSGLYFELIVHTHMMLI